MNKIVGIFAVLALVLALPVQAQSYPYSTSYGGRSAYVSSIDSQIAVSNARAALGYVPQRSTGTPNPALTQTAAKLEAWEHDYEVRNGLGASIGMTQEQIDQKWALHASIEKIYAVYVDKMHRTGKKVALLKNVIPSKDPMLPDTIFLIPTDGIPASAIPATATSAVSIPPVTQ